MLFTSAARLVTSRGPRSVTSWPNSPSATRRAWAASWSSGVMAVARRPRASTTTMTASPIATAMNTPSSASLASVSSATAWPRAPAMSASSTATLARSASKSALPRAMSGLTTGLQVLLT